MQMICRMTTLSVPRCNTCTLYIHANHFRQRLPGATRCKSFCSLSFDSESSEACSVRIACSRHRGCFRPFAMAGSLSSMGRQLSHGLSSGRQRLSIKLSVPTQVKTSKFRWNTRFTSWTLGGAFGMCLSFSTSGPICAESLRGIGNEKDEEIKSSSGASHGKKVYTDYSVTGIPGDGRCLFRSIAHGACIRSGKPVPSESLQRELADELRALVADELAKRRAETEWFIEGDFDTYVFQMRRPHVWGGEPELLMASHVLQMPITVYMHDEDSGGLIAIAEYGQEYGKDSPIQVLYHGYGHYESLQIPARRGAKSRL